MTTREQIEKELFERAMEKWSYSLKDLIESEKLYTYTVGHLSVLYYAEIQHALVPCNGYMILAREHYDDNDKKHIAEYAIYKLADKDALGYDNTGLDNNVFNYEAVYNLHHICGETFDNMALAICNATKWIYYGDE